MRTPKQIFCRHDWDFIGNNRVVGQVLHRCEKCGVYIVSHKFTNMEYKTDKFPINKGWEYLKLEVQE